MSDWGTWSILNPVFPCKECLNRKIRCHSICEKYQQRKINLEEIKLKKKLDKEKANYIVNSIMRKQYR